MKALLISGVECEYEIIKWINSLNFEYVIGLGDVECPNYIKNFYGILGETESVFVLKWLRSSGRLLDSRLHEISSDFSTEIVITHYPPSYLGKIAGVSVGSNEVYNKLILHKPKLLIHGHSENVGISKIGMTRVVSIGLLRDGNYAIYDSGEVIIINRHKISKSDFI